MDRKPVNLVDAMLVDYFGRKACLRHVPGRVLAPELHFVTFDAPPFRHHGLAPASMQRLMHDAEGPTALARFIRLALEGDNPVADSIAEFAGFSPEAIVHVVQGAAGTRCDDGTRSAEAEAPAYAPRGITGDAITVTLHREGRICLRNYPIENGHPVFVFAVEHGLAAVDEV